MFEYSLLGIYSFIAICIYQGLDIVCAVLSLAVLIIIACCMYEFS